MVEMELQTLTVEQVLLMLAVEAVEVDTKTLT
jgi:hypothetical protein